MDPRDTQSTKLRCEGKRVAPPCPSSCPNNPTLVQMLEQKPQEGKDFALPIVASPASISSRAEQQNTVRVC